MKFFVAVMSATLAVAWGCEKSGPSEAPAEASESLSAASSSGGGGAETKSEKVKTTFPAYPEFDGPLDDHPLAIETKKLWNRGVKAASSGDVAGLRKILVPRARQTLERREGWVKAFFSGTVEKTLEVNGGRIVQALVGEGAAAVVVAYYRGGNVRIDPAASRGFGRRSRSSDHPMNKELSLEEATRNVKGAGQLRMTLGTSRGDITCVLYEEKAPRAVANFVGLARGLRAFKLPSERSWVKRPFYAGQSFFRQWPGKLIGSGCPNNDGTGGPGYTFEDEFDFELRHNDAGVLGMLNMGPHSNGSQFYITAGPMPEFDDKYTVFGRCSEKALIKSLSQDETEGEGRASGPVAINSMEFFRKP